MAKFRTATFAAALLCFFTVSIARSTPETDEATSTQVALPLPSADLALRLPTETDPDSADMSSIPMTEISFRPVNRRFHMRSKRPCRHHFRFYPRNDLRDVVTVPSGVNFEQPMVRAEGNRIRGGWVRTQARRREEDSESDDEEDDDEVKKALFKRYVYDRFDRENKLKKLRKHFRVRNEEEAEKKPKKKSGLMRGVRKFLDRYI